MRRLFFLLAALLICFPAFAFWQSRDSAYNQSVSVSSYQGPKDIVGSDAVRWGSLARVYSAAKASTATSLADLVAVTGGAAVCTLRGSSSGYVDLTAYCTGGTQTPAAACAAASGGSCVTCKIYDQTPNNDPWTNTFGSGQCLPVTFSALNGLPGVTTVNATTSLLVTSNITQAQPFTFSAVCNHTANDVAATTMVGSSDSTSSLSWISGGGSAFIQAGSNVAQTATITTFHALQGVINNASSVIAIDGTETSGTAGTGAFNGTQALRVMRGGGGGTPTGTCMEFGFWGSAFNGTVRTNMNSNQHGATNGYNF